VGYDFHITRADSWLDSKQHPITFEEWQTYVATDPEIKQDTQNKPQDFLFITHDEVPFWWWEGEISTKNPDRATRQKLLEIARHFDAQVRDDDDVILISPDELLKSPHPKTSFFDRLLRFLQGNPKVR
jgi:hypothetical protein